MRLFLLSFFLFTSTTALSQDTTKIVLIDEFGNLQCDDVLARIDNFFIQLHNQSGTTGYFVIRGSDREILNRLAVEQLLRTGIFQRRYDPSLAGRRSDTEPFTEIA